MKTNSASSSSDLPRDCEMSKKEMLLRGHQTKMFFYVSNIFTFSLNLGIEGLIKLVEVNHFKYLRRVW